MRGKENPTIKLENVTVMLVQGVLPMAACS